MGVSGLQYYCEQNCKESFVAVNILKAAQEYKRKFKRTPVLVADGHGVIESLYGDKNWLSGGQWVEYVQNWKTFVMELKNAGIELKVFFDGTLCESKIPTWVTRRIESSKKIDTIFHFLKQGNLPPVSLAQLPTNLAFFTRYVLKRECGCECICSIRECDWEIAKYARENTCFGIIAQDSDFIIYDSGSHYFSAKHLNVSTFDTKEYRARELASSLGLRLESLPLFACLVGNDHITKSELRFFHNKLVQHRRNNLLPAVAKYISSKHGDLKGDALEMIAVEVFGNRHKLNKLKQAIAQYDLRSKNIERAIKVEESSKEPDLTAMAEKMYVSCDHPPTILSALCGAHHQSSNILEDSNSTFPSSEIVFRKIRQRVYFLLEVDKVKEWCTYKGCTMSGPDFVDSLQIDVASVDLKFLWSSVHNTDLKWMLYIQCVSKNLNINLLRNIPPQLVAICSILHYLLHETDSNILKDWEVDAVLLQAVQLMSTDTTQLEDIIVDDPLNPKLAELGTIIVRGLSNILIVVAAIGGPVWQADVMPWSCFDGKLLNVTYTGMKTGRAVSGMLHTEAEIKLFRLLKQTVTGS